MSESDRELLELAAKAAGYDTSHKLNEHRMLREPLIIGLCIKGVSTCWNPLTDDGDAFRLMVKLNLDVLPQPDGKVEVSTQWLTENEFFWVWEDNTTDSLRATRLAITRVAAEIGRRMA